jgi:Flp pilus assembly protein CpaB
MIQVQVNSDNNITGSEELSKFVREEIARTLTRFESQLTRVEVHLTDSNSHKPGLQDKRCVLEARPAGRQPLTTSSEAGTVEQAVRSAAEKMRNSLETLFGRLSEKRRGIP